MRRGQARDLTPRQAEIIRRRAAAYERAMKEFDSKKFKRGGGWTAEEIREIERRAGTKWPSNRAFGKLEKFDFLNHPPERLFAYYDRDLRCVTTWMGDVLGTIVHRGRESRPFGGRVVPIRVRAINGYMYSGRCNLSGGDYCRLRRGKRWRA